MSEQVTKPKNEGRVAAGKRLAEWNRKNKENLVKNQEQVDTSDDLSASSSTPSVMQNTYVIGGVILVAGIAALFLWKRKPTAIKPDTTDDLFRMN